MKWKSKGAGTGWIGVWGRKTGGVRMRMNKPGCEDYLEEVSDKKSRYKRSWDGIGRDGRITVKRSTEWKEREWQEER
jgi:hypothetical protein